MATREGIRTLFNKANKENLYPRINPEKAARQYRPRDVGKQTSCERLCAVRWGYANPALSVKGIVA